MSIVLFVDFECVLEWTKLLTKVSKSTVINEIQAIGFLMLMVVYLMILKIHYLKAITLAKEKVPS